MKIKKVKNFVTRLCLHLNIFRSSNLLGNLALQMFVASRKNMQDEMLLYSKKKKNHFAFQTIILISHRV